MFTKLTHKGRPTLVNGKNVTNVYLDINHKTNSYQTKISFVNGSIIFVDETMNEVHKLLDESELGITDNTYDYQVVVPNVEERFEQNFNQSYQPQPRGFNQPRQRRYNNHSNPITDMIDNSINTQPYNRYNRY